MKYKLIIDKDADEEIIAKVHAPSSLTEQIENLVCSFSGFESIMGYNDDEMKKLLFSEIERITVVAEVTGEYDYSQCETVDWTDVVAISAGIKHTVGLRSDGTVIAIGDDYYKQCDVDEWTNIVAVSAGGDNTVGLKHDGTLVICGEFAIKEYGVDSWKNIKMP